MASSPFQGPCIPPKGNARVPGYLGRESNLRRTPMWSRRPLRSFVKSGRRGRYDDLGYARAHQPIPTSPKGRRNLSVTRITCSPRKRKLKCAQQWVLVGMFKSIPCLPNPKGWKVTLISTDRFTDRAERRDFHGARPSWPSSALCLRV